MSRSRSRPQEVRIVIENAPANPISRPNLGIARMAAAPPRKAKL